MILDSCLDIRKQALTLIEVNDAKCARTGVALNPWQPQNACGNSELTLRQCQKWGPKFHFFVLKVERFSREVALPTSWISIHYSFFNVLIVICFSL